MDEKDAEIARLRAEIEVLKGERAGAEEAELAQPVVRSKKPGNFPLPWIVVGCGVIGLIVLLATQGAAPSSTTPATPTELAQVSTPDIPSPSPTESAPAPVAEPEAWSYQEIKDEMRDAATHLACSTSTNEVRLDWPYHNVSADLCVRKSPRFGTDVYFRLNGDGQILCQSYDGCVIKARFDDGAVQSFSASGSSDNSSNIVFVDNATRFIAALKKADATMMEVELYQAGVQAVRFNTKGLKWPPGAAKHG